MTLSSMLCIQFNLKFHKNFSRLIQFRFTTVAVAYDGHEFLQGALPPSADGLPLLDCAAAADASRFTKCITTVTSNVQE